MSEHDSIIEYAATDLEPSGDRLLRHIVALWSIVNGATRIVGTSLHIGLAKGWLRSPPTMGWSFGGAANMSATALGTASAVTLVIGGLLLLPRKPIAIVLIRTAIVADLILAVLGTVIALTTMPTYASYWSTPAAAAVYVIGFLQNLWQPLLIGLLTLPPLARRMV